MNPHPVDLSHDLYCEVCYMPTKQGVGNFICDLHHVRKEAIRRNLAATKRFRRAGHLRLLQAQSAGRDGWWELDKTSPEFLADLAVKNLVAGDFVDASNFLMFLHERGDDPHAVLHAIQRYANAMNEQAGLTLVPKPEPALDSLPESGEEITVILYGTTGVVGSRSTEEIDVDKGQWEAATDTQREAYVREWLSNVVEWGYYVKTEEDD